MSIYILKILRAIYLLLLAQLNTSEEGRRALIEESKKLDQNVDWIIKRESKGGEM